MTKLKLAKDELSEALKLFLEDRNPISYFLLAFASHEIIKNIANGKEVKSVLKDDLATKINEAGFDIVMSKHYGKEYKKYIKKNAKSKVGFFVDYDYNQSKHGGSDPDEEIVVHWEIAEIIMVDSIEMLRLIGEKLRAEYFAYIMWIKKTQPEIYVNENLEKVLMGFESIYGPVTKENLCDFIGSVEGDLWEDFIEKYSI